MEKALKDMEISSQGERNSFFLALFKHVLKWDWRQPVFFPELGEKRLGKFDDTHTNQRYFMPPLQPKTCCWEKTRKDEVKTPTHSFRKLWGLLKYAVGLGGGNRIWCSTGQMDKAISTHQLSVQKLCSVRVLLQDQELWLYWEHSPS